jgi:hypothetical protein
MACEVDFDAELHAFAEVGVGGDASARVSYDRNAPGSKIGFSVDEGENAQQKFHVTTPPHLSFKDGNLASLHGRCSLQPSINVVGSVGLDPTHPFVDAGVKLIVEPYAQLDANFRSMHDWSVDAKLGIEGTVSPFGDFVGRHWERTDGFTLFDYTLAQVSR